MTAVSRTTEITGSIHQRLCCAKNCSSSPAIPARRFAVLRDLNIANSKRALVDEQSEGLNSFKQNTVNDTFVQ